MSEIKIEKLNELKNASRFGACSICGTNSYEVNIVRIKFNGVSVALCKKHLKELQTVIDDCFILGGV